MILLAIDPGNAQSAYVRYDTGRDELLQFGKIDNDALLHLLPKMRCDGHLAIEMIASYGMAVGREVFDTCVWIGRFIETWAGEYTQVYRKDVKLHLCGQTRAKDANIRAALIDRFGPGKAKAIGTSKAKGPLFGVSADVWAALAVAVTHADSDAITRGRTISTPAVSSSTETRSSSGVMSPLSERSDGTSGLRPRPVTGTTAAQDGIA